MTTHDEAHGTLNRPRGNLEIYYQRVHLQHWHGVSEKETRGKILKELKRQHGRSHELLERAEDATWD